MPREIIVEFPSPLTDREMRELGYEPVVRCKYCKHKPTGTGVNHDIEFPDEVCPCQCVGDYWYSWMPKDNFFCAWGESKEEEGMSEDEVK